MVLIIGYHMFDMLTRVTFSDVMNPAMRFLEMAGNELNRFIERVIL